jgi:hypothetical protein
MELINPKCCNSEFLTCTLSTDFTLGHPELIDDALSEIEKVEKGEIEIGYAGGGEGFGQTITKDLVTFEHTIFCACPHWPLWSCTLEQYKTALLAWKHFINLPWDIDTEYTVELPDSTVINRPFDYDASFDDQVDDLLDKVLQLEVGEISVFHFKGVNYEQTWTDSEVSFIYPLDPESRQWQVHPYTLAEHKAEILSWKQAILYAKTHEIDG